MKYHKLDANGDSLFGQGNSDFHINTPEAVQQAVRTRLALDLGEWFLDTSDGTPWETSVLGKYTRGIRDMVIRTRILETPGVQRITSYLSFFDSNTRKFSVNVTVETIYGQVTIAGPI